MHESTAWMNFLAEQKTLNDEKKIRQARLNALIEESFGHLAPDEVYILSAEYKKSETRVFDVIRVGSRSTVLSDLCADIEFRHVLFPKELLPFLKKADVFMGTIGLKDSAWTVLHLSPCYEVSQSLLDQSLFFGDQFDTTTQW